MKKKVKKIPKFKNGTPDVFQRIGSGFKKFGNNIVDNFKNMETDDLLAGISGASSALASGLGIEQTKFSQTAEALAPIIDMAVPGLGTGFKTFAQFTGGGGGTDGFGNAQYANGLTRWLGLGRSDDSVMKQANREKGSILAKQFTEDLKADYANQGINPAPNALAAEGAIIDNSTQVLVSPGELIYDYKNKTLTKVPFGNGKPNTDDNVFMKVEQGDKKGVLNNKADMGTTVNGKTLAMRFEPMIDKPNKKFSKGTIDARDAIVKKALRVQEQHKTGPQEYAAFNTGMDNIDKVKNWGGNNPYAPSNMGNNTWWTYVKNLADQFGESVEQFLNRAKLRGEDLAKFGSTGLIPYVNPITGTVSFALPWGSKYIDGSTHADDVITNEKVAAPVVKDDQTVVVPQVNEKTTNAVDKNIAKVSPKKEITKKEIPVKKLDKSVGVLETPDLSKQYSRADTYNPNLVQLGKDPFKKLEEKLFEPVQPIESELTTSNYSNPGWQDWLYRTALLTQPWWDMAKAEPVNYTLPNAKYISVGADPTPLMKSADETYSIGNYNFAQFGGSTGQRMGYGAALANNRAKQYADAYKWQQDVQNKQIAQNVGIYNNWDTQRTEILNNVFDKTAANRATARNINRQNRDAALSNYGQMLFNDKQFYADVLDKKLKTKLLEPFIQSVYENSDELMPALAQYSIGKNIKKKQNNR